MDALSIDLAQAGGQKPPFSGELPRLWYATDLLHRRQNANDSDALERFPDDSGRLIDGGKRSRAHARQWSGQAARPFVSSRSRLISALRPRGGIRNRQEIEPPDKESSTFCYILLFRNSLKSIDRAAKLFASSKRWYYASSFAIRGPHLPPFSRVATDARSSIFNDPGAYGDYTNVLKGSFFANGYKVIGRHLRPFICLDGWN